MQNNQQSIPPPPPGYTSSDIVPASGPSQGPPPPPPGYNASDIMSNNGVGSNVSEGGTTLQHGVLNDVSSGIAEGEFGTLQGLENISEKLGPAGGLLGATKSITGTDYGLKDELGTLSKEGQPTTTGEKVGQGLETIGEFLLGDEALKGLSLADKLTSVSKVMKYIEKSPKLAQALRLGINVGKVGADLSPEERELLKAHPVLARLASVGLDALRQGTTQAAQTGVKTGGDIGEAAKSGGEMAAASGIIGAPLGLLGDVVGKGAAVANNAQDLAENAKNAPTANDVNEQLGATVQGAVQPDIDAAQTTKDNAQKVLDEAYTSVENAGKNAPEKAAMVAKAQNAAKAGEQAVRDAYTAASNAIRNDPALKGITIDGTGSAFQEKAANAAFGADQGDDITKLLGADLPASEDVMRRVLPLAKPGGALDIDPATGLPRKLGINDLLDYAKIIKERIRQTGYSNPQDMRDRQVYYDLLDGIHQSVEDLTKQAGKPELMEKVLQMNGAYKKGLQTFRNPDVQALLRGSNENSIINTITGGKSVGDIRAMKEAIGPDAFASLADDAMQRLAADSVDPVTHEFNLQKWVKNMNNIPDDVRAEMFKGTKKSPVLESILNQVRSVHAAGQIPEADQAIKEAQSTITDLLGGKPNIDGLLKDPAKVKRLSALLGPDTMGELGNNIIQNQLRESATKNSGKIGTVDTGKFLNFVASLKDSPEVVDAFFRPTPERAAAYDQLLKSVHNVDRVKEMIKFGLITPVIGATAGGLLGHTGLSLILGAAAAEATGGSVKFARDILDHISNSPATWATLKGIGNAAQSGTAKATANLGRVAAGKYVAPTVHDYLKKAFGNTGTQLGNQ